MSATTIERNTNFAGVVPSKGTMAVAANKLILKGTIVAVDGDGRADPAGAGLNAVGKASSTVDNRTTAPSGGGAGAESIEVEYGVFGFAFSGTTPEPGQVVFVADNQTVNTDSSSGTRGIAGYVSEVRGSTCYVLMGPTVAGQIVIAASEASQLDTAQADIDTAEAAIVVLQGETADLLVDVAEGFVPVTIGMSPAWVDNTSNGFDPAVFAWGFNPTIDDEPFIATVPLPADLDTAEDVIVTARCAISSVTTDDDVVMVLVARINGGADVAPESTTVLSVAAQNIVFTIPAASVPAGSKSLFLAIRCANTLDTHDGYLYSLDVKFTRTVASA